MKQPEQRTPAQIWVMDILGERNLVIENVLTSEDLDRTDPVIPEWLVEYSNSFGDEGFVKADKTYDSIPLGVSLQLFPKWNLAIVVPHKLKGSILFINTKEIKS